MSSTDRAVARLPEVPTETEDRTDEVLARIAEDASEAPETYLRETVSPGGGE